MYVPCIVNILLFIPTNAQYINSNVYFVKYSDMFQCTLERSTCYQLDTPHMHGEILYAACTEITCLWWTIICSKHVENSLTGIN
jgi:hypothetical protein